MTHILISGAIGSGKSTVVRRVMERLGWPRPAGFFTTRTRGPAPEVLISTWAGETRRLARPGAGEPPYRLDEPAFLPWAVEQLRAAPPDAPMVLDELGVLELPSRSFTEAVAGVFQRPGPLLVVIQERALDRWIDLIGRGNADAFFRVATDNRDRLPA